jgi:uncharacterized protein YeaO (DUF488 family)
MMIKLKRVYDTIDESDGYRILVDRLWPRGLSKNKVEVDEWLKDIAPSDRLRKWYAHDVSKWSEFKRLYFLELSSKENLIRAIIDKRSNSTITLVYAAKDNEHNNAVALKEYIENIDIP